jgi:thiaminase
MRIVILLSLLILGTACVQNSEPTVNTNRIEALEAELRSKERMDTTIGNALIKEYNVFVAAHPKDSMAAVYLFKKAEVLKATNGKENEAIDAYKAVFQNYAYHQKGAESMLALALFYEEMRSKDLAAATYQKFIATYPSNVLADNARQLLDLLDNTKETEIQMVQKWKEEAKNSEK